jgi:hypothetical protein
MQNEKAVGLGYKIKHNDTVQPNNELLAVIKSTVSQFFGWGPSIYIGVDKWQKT